MSLHPTSQPFTFETLDGLGFAAERGGFDPTSIAFTAGELGPVFELGLLAKSNVLRWPGSDSWLATHSVSPLIAALTGRKQQWTCSSSRAMGIYRTCATVPQDDVSWVQFGVSIRRAAISAGFPRLGAAQLVGAIGEMQDNIYQHSGAPHTGIIAFRANTGYLEWVVCDSGIGVLKSLTSCPEFRDVTNDGEALRLTLADGVSRHGRASGRGLGYQPLFTGLANLRGSLRFRSGSYALTIDGENPISLPVKLAQKVRMNGFLISITCRC